MPEKKVQRIEKIHSLPIWGTKQWAFTRVSAPACLPSSTVGTVKNYAQKCLQAPAE